ncbi:MAG: VPLPA-CTERM sorting domain-containing protein [Pseudomonadota bacterium]
MIGKLGIALVALVVAATSSSAATYTWTEGNGQNRKLVAGSTDLEDANPGSPGFELNALAFGGTQDDAAAFGFGDSLQIHGRIVSSQDTFSFKFSFNSAFRVLFDLDGYELADGLSSSIGTELEPLSGLVDQVARRGNPSDELGDEKAVRFILSGGAGPDQVRVFETNVLDGATPFIFGGEAGTEYVLTVDGNVQPTRNIDALYDLRIVAVPLPAAGLLLLGALGGLAAFRRHKKPA